MMIDLSIIIPARNEEFLQRTIDSIFSQAKGNIEIIAILDGYWPEEGIRDHPRLKLIHHSESIGQRAATNEGVNLSRAKFIMKLDAHCHLDEAFDIKLMANCEYDWTVIPRMYVLDAFHWICLDCGKEHDQGPIRKNCDSCDGIQFERKIIWEPKHRKKTDYMWIDPDLRIKYFDRPGLKGYGSDINASKKLYSHKLRDWAQGDITDVMVGIGACWFQYRDRYLELGGLDEDHGSWGQVAVEIAMKAWLSGGRHVVNKNTWFAHLPRTQPGFSWPYQNPASDQEIARGYSKDLWLNDKWDKQIYPSSWLIEKFAPVPGWDNVSRETIPIEIPSNKLWDKETLRYAVSRETIGLVYYTDNQCEERIAQIVRNQLLKMNLPIVSVSHYPINFGTNIIIRKPRGILTMFRQILMGLEELNTDIAFLVEHDVIYHPSHFQTTIVKNDIFYYNEHTYKLEMKTGQALFYYTKQTSGLSANRKLLIEHYRKRIDRVEKEGFSRRMGFEPGCHHYPRGVDNYNAGTIWSTYPNIDIRHKNNLTSNRFKKEQFRSHRSIKGWKLTDEIPGWGITKGRPDDFLLEVSNGQL